MLIINHIICQLKCACICGCTPWSCSIEPSFPPRLVKLVFPFCVEFGFVCLVVMGIFFCLIRLASVEEIFLFLNPEYLSSSPLRAFQSCPLSRALSFYLFLQYNSMAPNEGFHIMTEQVVRLSVMPFFSFWIEVSIF